MIHSILSEDHLMCKKMNNLKHQLMIPPDLLSYKNYF